MCICDRVLTVLWVLRFSLGTPVFCSNSIDWDCPFWRTDRVTSICKIKLD